MLQAPLPLSPVETSDHTISFYISDGFFSHVALCCNGTSTHENTHGKLFEDISGAVWATCYTLEATSNEIQARRLQV